MIPEISVPSFPNVFAGKDRLYYREEASAAITFRYIEFPTTHYTPLAIEVAENQLFQHAASSLNNAISITNSDTLSGADILYSTLQLNL